MPDEIDGYGGYKFGMTLKEADAVRDDDAVVSCDYVGVKTCIEREGNFFGEKGVVTVQFDLKTNRVRQILITFRRLDGEKGQKACRKVLETIATPLIDTYGKPRISEDNSEIAWYARRGGRVQLTKLCITEDTGAVIVSYAPSEPF